MTDNNSTFMVEDAQIVFRNFAGKEDQYNREGDRNFAVLLPAPEAEAMLADGWNVKYLKPREDEDGNIEDPTPYIQVAVSFKNRPPRVMMITSTARTALNEGSVEVLDYSVIAKADLIARAYNWEVNGKTGTKAYLQSLFVTIEEDALERKYALQELSDEMSMDGDPA